jgi:hypothetical protein
MFSAPTIGFVANPTIGGNVNIGQDLTVTRDLKVTRNLNVDGTVTIGGTSATIFAETLKISDPDIILGVRTDAGGNDISNDTTANHGGVALASTEGSPLITLINPGAGETLPSTYKKIMWFKTNSFTGLNTDAWLTNYAFGVGTTSMSAGTKFAVGNIEADFDDITSVRHINSTGVGTFTTLDIGTGGIDVDGHTELDNLNVSGASTLGTVQISSGIVTATSGVVTYYGDGSNLVDLTGASAGTYGDSSSTAVIQVDSDGRITGIATTNIDGLSEISADTTPQLGGDLDLNGNDITGTGNINITGVITATSFDGSIDFSKVTGVTTDISADTTPQLGGDLDLNGNDITGTGNINVTGVVTATSFDGSIDFSKVTGVTTEISADTTPQLGGDLDLNSNFIQLGGDLDLNSNFITGSGGINVTGVVTATSFDGSIDFSKVTGVTTEISADTTPQLGGDLDLNGNDITGTGNINITGVITATSFDGSIDFSKVTGVTTEISADTTPQLGGDLDLNSNFILT